VVTSQTHAAVSPTIPNLLRFKYIYATLTVTEKSADDLYCPRCSFITKPHGRYISKWCQCV